MSRLDREMRQIEKDWDLEQMAKDADKVAGRLFRAQLRRMWPMLLASFVFVLALAGGGVWLLLYILETYVGKA